MKKIITIIFIFTIVLSSMMGAVAFASNEETDINFQQSVVKYIKNSYTTGAYLFEENGYLRYGIPVSAAEKEYQWEFIEHDGNYEIKNVATGHTLTLRGGIGTRTALRTVDDVKTNDLWKLDITLLSDEFQNIVSASDEFKGIALHIIEVTDGYVSSEEIGSMLSYGEAKWGLFDESEINFEGVIRDGFCIGFGTGTYLNATESSLTFDKPSGPSDNYIWNFIISDNGKKVYNLGQKKYLSVVDGEVTLSDESSATVFTLFASKSATITSDIGCLASKSNELKIVNKGNAASFELVLASAVGTVLGDLKLEGIYTFSNSWFNMYMLDDGSVPTYGNSSPKNTQIQWKTLYDEGTGNTALMNVGRNEYLYLSDGQLAFSKDIIYYWKLLRNSNDLYPNAVRFQDASNSKVWLHMENTNGRLECSSSVQSTWGSPHWEPKQYVEGASATTESTSVETDKWFRIKSRYSDNLYFYQTNGGYAYGTVSENDSRSHWKFLQDGDSYLLYNRSYGMYLSSLGNGYLSKTEYKEEATRFGISIYTDDSSLLIYEKNAKDYQASYINIKERDQLIHLSLVSVDIKETRWFLEEAPEEINANEIVINNTQLPTFVEFGEYRFDGKSVKVEHYASFVRVTDGKKYLFVNKKGKTSWKKFTNDYDTSLCFNYTTLGDDLQIHRDSYSAVLKQSGCDRAFALADGFTVGKQSIISVYAQQSGEYIVKINTLQTGISTTILVDGISQQTFRTGETDEVKLRLNRGNNVIKVTRNDAVDSIIIKDIISNGYYGATQGITAYELENGVTNSNVLVDNRERYSMESEATGRSFVKLENITDYVEITLLEDMNALTLRYSVPDTKNGEGDEYTLSMYINGKERTNLVLSSKKAHLYKDWDYTNNPDDGYHHVYFDEVTYKFDEILTAGTVIRFRRDFDDEAEYYALDLLETEIVANKVEKPSNSLSVTDYGAIPNDGKDDTEAFKNCLKDAVSQRKEVYFPEGEYEIHEIIPLTSNNIVICGAGYWYTTINGIQFSIGANNIGLYSMKLIGDHNTRRDTLDRACIEVMNSTTPTNLIIANLWMNYYKVGAWLDGIDEVFISGNRIRYTYADGINLHAGVNNAVVENNSIRSTGDDGLAEWSDGEENVNLTFRHNTIENPWLANCIALYGGTNLNVYNNICKDTAYVGAGVNISTNFLPTNFKGELNVVNNIIIRCGSDNDSSNRDVGGIWFNMVVGYDAFAQMSVCNNVILDSTHQGISFNGSSTICSLILENNVISNSGSYGIDISSEFTGKMLIKNNAISGSALEDILDGSSERNAEIVIADDEIVIQTNNTEYIVLWVVASILLVGAIVCAVLFALPLIIKNRRTEL